MIGYLITATQALLFVALLPVYSAVYLEIFNRLQNLVYPSTLSDKLALGLAHWRHLEFGRPFEALFSISASATTVFVISFVAWWYL